MNSLPTTHTPGTIGTALLDFKPKWAIINNPIQGGPWIYFEQVHEWVPPGTVGGIIPLEVSPGSITIDSTKDPNGVLYTGPVTPPISIVYTDNPNLTPTSSVTQLTVNNIVSALTNPMNTAQDIIVGGAAGVPARLGVGLAGQVLTVIAGILGWQYPSVPASISFPIGCVMLWAGFSGAPSGWLICNGGTLDKATYQNLYNVIGGYWGFQTGTTFTLPNFMDRAPVGPGSSFGLAQMGGEQMHVLSLAEIPSHTHTQELGGTITTVQPAAGAGVIGQANSQETAAAGSSLSHNNMPPYLAIYYIIKY